MFSIFPVKNEFYAVDITSSRDVNIYLTTLSSEIIFSEVTTKYIGAPYLHMCNENWGRPIYKGQRPNFNLLRLTISA